MNSFSFPEGFLWGTATSGHQIEGNNIASDWWAWEPGKIRGNLTSGRACDAWNRYEEDYALMESMGLNAYRMGIEWSRVQPAPGRWDDEAFEQYEAMMESLSSKGIAICLTLYHWVLPRWVADNGGWENPATVDAFARFCEQTAVRLGRYPLLWCTLNEPNVYTMSSYVTGEFPPEKKSLRAARKVMRHLLTAHAVAYSIINSYAHSASEPEGAHTRSHRPLIGIAHNMTPIAPARRNLFDRMIAGFQNRAWNTSLIDALATGIMTGPFGDGRPVDGLAGSYTYMGVNYYYRRIIAFKLNGIANGFSEDVFPPGIARTDFGWPIVPEGLYDSLMQASALKAPIYITENGIADARDTMRPRYIVDHLAQTRRAIDAGADVRGYFHWAFQDNFEWRDGYTQQFGLYALDAEDQELTRVPRPSARLYASIAQANGVTEEVLSRISGASRQAQVASRAPQ